MAIREALSDALQCDSGGFSCMRMITAIVCLTVLIMWVIFCFVEGRFVPISWEMVSLIGASQGAKAVQYGFEHKHAGN